MRLFYGDLVGTLPKKARDESRRLPWETSINVHANVLKTIDINTSGLPARLQRALSKMAEV